MASNMVKFWGLIGTDDTVGIAIDEVVAIDEEDVVGGVAFWGTPTFVT